MGLPRCKLLFEAGDGSKMDLGGQSITEKNIKTMTSILALVADANLPG